jgi:hypothetical protein
MRAGDATAGDQETEDQAALEVLVLTLQAATDAADQMPFGVDQAYQGLGLQLAADNARRLLPEGHEIAAEAHEAARPYIEPAAALEDPAAVVVRLLEEAGEILAGLPAHPGSSELTITVADLLQEAKSAAPS